MKPENDDRARVSCAMPPARETAWNSTTNEWAGEHLTGMESFAELLEQSEVEKKMRPGVIIDGTVLAVGSEYVTVHAGLKSESTIPVEQFRNENGEVEVAVGDRVEVALDTVEDGFGATKLSREKAKRAKAWNHLEAAFEDEETVTGIINGKVKGGFTVDINDIRAFLPGSLVDVRPGARYLLPRRQAAGFQGDQARSPPQQRGRLAARGGRAGELRRARSAAREPPGGSRAARRREEPDRLRRIRGPRRDRRPAAHHRHGVEAGQAPDRGRQCRRRGRGQGAEVRIASARGYRSG